MRARITWRQLLAVGLVCGISGPTGRSLSASQDPALNAAQSGGPAGYRVPRSFEQNQGQTDAQVKFLSRGNGYTVFLTSTEAVLSLRRPRESTRSSRTAHLLKGQTQARTSPGQGEQQSLVLHLQPIGANAAPRIIGESALPGTVNYLRGNAAKNSLEGIATYRRVRYEDVYPGIDLIYYDNGHQLEYDVVVAPGADPDRVRLRFSGADTPRIEASGDLVLHTAMGELRQPAPLIYQEVDGVRRVIPGSYILENADHIGFQVGPYDHTRPLVIDPVLAYSTYFGGDSEESGWDIAVDAVGNAYVTGARPSVRSEDAYDYDAYVAKFSAAGQLLWVTDVGDTCDDEGRGIALDAARNVYVTGSLGSCYPFPTLTAGAFVAKLTPSGAGSYLFAFSDYWYGGADVGQAVAVDGAGRAYVTGLTTSVNFSIAAPFVNVTAPAAGAVWTIGSAKTIAWTSNLGSSENVEIRLSKDGGATYPVLITGNTPSDGKHPVTVKAAWGSQSVTRLKVTWLKAAGVEGVSSTFTIQP
jgi:hypothetical protein